MNSQTALSELRRNIELSSEAHSEPEWLKQLRLRGAELSETLPLPQLEKTRLDRWDLSSLGALKTYTASEVSQAAQASIPDYAVARLADEQGRLPANLLVQHNSGVIHSSLDETLRAKGVIFTSLQEAIIHHEQLVKTHLMTVIPAEENRLTALHTAEWSGGLFLYVPENVQIDTPLQALFAVDDPEASFSPHVLIVADRNSSITYVDQYISEGTLSGLVHNGEVEIVVKSGAKVTYASIHELKGSVTDLTVRRALVGTDGTVEFAVGEMNDGNAVSDTSALLQGQGARSDAKIICVGTGSQKLNVTTKAVHYGRNTDSNMITRAVMRDEATAIFNGITKIEKGATKANGQQAEKVMMLSRKARGDANPILLIDEDDVMAGHAASAGQVNPEQIYYLMSRGIAREEAERLIIYGFLDPVVAEIPADTVRSQLQRVVERKLGQ